jgi:hypothetical protein
MITFELVCIKNHAVLVTRLIVLGSCVLANNVLFVIGLLVMVQCWAMCRVIFKEFGSVYIGVSAQWKMIFQTGLALRICTLQKATEKTYRKIILRAMEMT